MGDDFDFRKFRAVLIAGVLFLISTWKMWVEFKYLIWGARAEATVTSMEEKEHRTRRGVSLNTHVHFQYPDQSTNAPASGTYVESSPGTWAVGQQLQVQYLPGVADSARKGVDIVMVILFAVSTGAISWILISMARDARAPIPTSRKSKSSSKKGRPKSF